MPPVIRSLLTYTAMVASVAVIGWFDLITGTELAFSVFYLLPVLAVTWSLHRKAGLATALLTALAWSFADTFGQRTFSSPVMPVWNTLIRFGTFSVVVLLLSSLRRQLAFATHLVRTDALTELVARRHFLELLAGEIRRARRYGHPLSIAYIDVDDFKRINDRDGHAAGDDLLRLVGETLRSATRDIDVAARVGGDEFMLLMPETSGEAAQTSIARLHDVLAHSVSERGGTPTTFSTGVLTFLRPPEHADQAVREVDHLMYRVKRDGKNGFLHRVVD